MSQSSASSVSRLEVGLLGAMLFALPLFEVPKHLLWAAWITVAMAGLWSQNRQPGDGELRRAVWHKWDAVFAAVLVAALLAGTGYADAGTSLVAAGDTIRMLTVPWLMARRRYDVHHTIALLWAMLAGTVLAVVWAGWVLATAQSPRFLELNSVGHVNHSAIYLAIALGGALGLVIAQSRLAVQPVTGVPGHRQAGGRALMGLALAAALLLAVALLVTGSRAAVGAVIGCAVLLFWSAPLGAGDSAGIAVQRRRLRFGLLILLLLASGGYRLAIGLSDGQLQPPGGGLIEKFDAQSSAGAPASYRDGLLRLSWAAASAHPWFGVGNRGFRLLTPAWVCQTQLAARAESPCDTSAFFFSSHAHSVYANTLAERGALGLAALLALLGTWGWCLRGALDWARSDPRHGAVWVASLAAWSVTALAGLLNTTLHHEHGLLAMAMLGVLLSARNPSLGGGAQSDPEGQGQRA